MHSVRKQFPIFQKATPPFVYLDSAATTQKPQCMIDAIQSFYKEQYATVHRAVYAPAARATENYETVRIQAQHFLGARSSEEIVFTKGTTEGINLIAHSLGKILLQEGDEILVSATEHHSNIVPWQLLCQEKRALLKVIPIDAEGTLQMTAYKALLSPRTKLVCIAHMTNTTGTIYPLAEVISLAHAQGAYVVVDGAQGAAHLPINVEELDADFYLFSGHKAYGPTGIGVLYGKKELLTRMPPYQSGGDMVQQVHWEGTSFQDPPLRFEAGTPPIAEVIGLGKALAFIDSLGKQKIVEWEQGLVQYAVQKLQQITGLRILGNAAHRGGILTFVIKGYHPLDLGTLLGLRGIAIRTGHLCAQPALRYFGVDCACRISFGVYTTHEEIDLFATALQEILGIL